MPTNVYFSPKVKTEQNLYEDIIIESLKMYGQETYYLPRDIVERDFILGEPVESQFADAYMIEMYIENTEGFGGEGDLMSKFGLEIRDTATFIVSKRRWEQSVGFWSEADSTYRPNEGDLIYLPMSKSFFQIDRVEHEQPFYQLQNLPTYKLNCSLYEFNEEEFNTGIAEIDRVADVYGGLVAITLNDLSPNNSILVGETITQTLTSGATLSATVSTVSKTGSAFASITAHSIVSSDGEFTEFLDGGSVSFSLSGITGTINKAEASQGQSSESAPDEFASNFEIQHEADSIIDFSESNPFGEI